MQACQQRWVTANRSALVRNGSPLLLSSPDHYFIAQWMLSCCRQDAYTFPQRWKTNRGNLFPQIRYWSQIVCWASETLSEKWKSNANDPFFHFFPLLKKQKRRTVNSSGHDILAVISSLWRDHVWWVLFMSCLCLQWSQLLPQSLPKQCFAPYCCPI